MNFKGLEPKALALLAELPKLDQAQYRELQPALKAGLQEPAKLLISELAAALDPDLVVGAASLSPLHNDLRFAKAGTPRYKDHLLMTTWQGANRKMAPTLWCRIAPGSIGFASGVAFTPASRTAWREHVAGKAGVAVSRAIAKVLKAHPNTAELAGGRLKRVPAPWDESHAREELLRLQGFQLRYSVPAPRSMGSKALSRELVKRLSELMPVHRWLVAQLGD